MEQNNLYQITVKKATRINSEMLGRYQSVCCRSTGVTKLTPVGVAILLTGLLTGLKGMELIITLSYRMISLLLIILANTIVCK